MDNNELNWPKAKIYFLDGHIEEAIGTYPYCINLDSHYYDSVDVFTHSGRYLIRDNHIFKYHPELMQTSLSATGNMTFDHSSCYVEDLLVEKIEINFNKEI